MKWYIVGKTCPDWTRYWLVDTLGDQGKLCWVEAELGVKKPLIDYNLMIEILASKGITARVVDEYHIEVQMEEKYAHWQTIKYSDPPY